jgi:hypothetical protein
MSKTEAEDTLKISTSFLKRHGYFSSIWKDGIITWTADGCLEKYTDRVKIEVSFVNDENYLRIRYTINDCDTNKKKDFDYEIPIVATPCHYGGERYWFICPWYKNNKYCGNRISILYKNGDYFACRHCSNLTYKSRNINHRGRTSLLFDFLNLDEKALELSKQISRTSYKGRPTRKQRRLEKIHQKIEGISHKIA